jgi:hypothetical protein
MKVGDLVKYRTAEWVELGVVYKVAPWRRADEPDVPVVHVRWAGGGGRLYLESELEVVSKRRE